VAGREPDAELAAAVRRRCGGNPLFVRELTRLMVARGRWDPADVAVPEGVADTLRRRMARLSGPCADLLEVAAIVGADGTRDVLARSAPEHAADVEELLDEAVRAGVLVGTGGGWRFAHDLHRETVLAGIPASRRAERHAAVGRALVELSEGGTDPAAVGGAARLAAHFVAAGRAAADQALHYCVLAAREATARLGHDDAARLYATALNVLPDAQAGDRRIDLLLALAAARDRAGDPDASREAYLRAADLARTRQSPAALAGAALGVAALGARTGADDTVALGLLREADAQLTGAQEQALRSRVRSAFARALRHSTVTVLDPAASVAARGAVELASASGDASALAHALLALHDVIWAPGAAAERLPVLARMSAAAERAGDHDVAAEAVLLRAAALIEQGDPDGPVELLRYTRIADRLGHARGRWGALSRRATLAELVGRVDEAVTLAGEALELGQAIGLPDAMGCFATLRGSLAAIGGPQLPLVDLLPSTDPLWPVYPLLRAWGEVHAGDLDAARSSLSGFSVHAMPGQYHLELVVTAAVVFAAVGTAEQRDWAYRTLAPHAGLHAVVGGCAAYHGAVDHHLGALAAAAGRVDDAIGHYTSAIAQHERLGAAAWAELSRDHVRRLRAEPEGDDTFRLVDGMWRLRFDHREVHLPEAKGLRDIATLLATPHRRVHVLTLLGRPAGSGAEPALDRRAVAEYRARLAELEAEIDQAETWNDPHRAARARAERDALVAQLRTTTGLGGRTRRLGDDTERARKTATARIRDALRRIERVHPALATHLQSTLHTGTTCSYTPDTPRHWRL
jgi:tetratricopeptide (TPR) repeat protein